MDRYETYRSNAAEAPIMRRWLFAALVLSLGIHAAFFFYAYRKQLHGIVVPQERLAPPILVSMKRVAIPKMDEPGDTPAKTPSKTTSTAPAKVEIPSEKPQVEDIHIAPQIATLPKQMLNEKPKVDIAGLEQLTKDAGTKNAMEKELNAVATALLKEGPKSPRQPIIPVGGSGNVGSGAGESNMAIPGTASIDEALAATAPLKTGGKIGVQGGALFEYDSYDLRPDSVELLRKLGALIERNPRATFSIEGHSDSFGNPEYNQRLSEKRAESVKLWLVEMMHIAPERIQTRGLGNTRPIVPSDRSKEEQAPNRRVEIVVKTGGR